MTVSTQTNLTHNVPHSGMALPDPHAWDAPAWADVPVVAVDQWSDGSSAHRPRTQAKVVYSDNALLVNFRVTEDRFTRVVHDQHQSLVCQDSCVEFFFQPDPERGYFNAELSMGGKMLIWHITEPNVSWTELAIPWIEQMQIHVTHPGVRAESTDVITWGAAYRIPYAVLENYMGPLDAATPGPGVQWGANFYKCADGSSFPHWGAWSPIIEAPFSFHRPECFGTLAFQ